MSLSFHQLAASPVTIRFRECALRVAPNTLGDFAEWEAWVRQQYTDAVERQTRAMHPADRAQLIIGARERARAIRANSPEAAAALDRPDGMAEFAAIALRHCHPNMTADALVKLVAIDELRALVARIIAIDSEHAPPARDDEPTDAGDAPGDYAKLLHVLGAEYGYTAQQIVSMTLAQISAAIEGANRDHTESIDRTTGRKMKRFQSVEAAQEFIAKTKAKKAGAK